MYTVGRQSGSCSPIVEVKDVALPRSMQRAMVKQAEAERQKRAKIIDARGAFEG